MELGEDIGQRAVQKIHRHPMIDEPWTLRADRGFLWLGHRLAQGVASPPFESREVLGSMITISTPLVDHVTAEPADVRLLSCADPPDCTELATGIAHSGEAASSPSARAAALVS